MITIVILSSYNKETRFKDEAKLHTRTVEMRLKFACYGDDIVLQVVSIKNELLSGVHSLKRVCISVL